MDWSIPQKPAEITENRLIEAILEGHFPISSHLPAERDLAAQLGVTRPTLREALQRLGRDGWVEIRQGRPTRVRDYWHEGSLGVLGAIARHTRHVPPDFVPNLLLVRELLAPAYTRLAVELEPGHIQEFLTASFLLNDEASAFALFDWQLHHTLTIASGNPIFTLILNGFRELYQPMACIYFQSPVARGSSRAFYRELEKAARQKDAQAAEEITRQVMVESLELWLKGIHHTDAQNIVN